jgi:hypothetical protein
MGLPSVRSYTLARARGISGLMFQPGPEVREENIG